MLLHNQKTKTMENSTQTQIQKLEQELKDLQKALQNNLISVNYYCNFYYAISQKIKKINHQ